MEFIRSLSLLRDVKARSGGMGISALGIGSAGCHILSYLHRSNTLIENFIYISCDDQDFSYSPLGEKMLITSDTCLSKSPSAIRGTAIGYVGKIRKILADSKYVFVISGLGGNTGSGLSPLVAKVAKESKATVVSIVAMPSKSEKNKHFYAGVALRQIRKLSDAVIIIDNDSFLERAPKGFMLETYALVNEMISTAFNKLIEPPQGKEVGVGLKRFVDTISREGYAILSVCESFKANEEVLVESSRSLHQMAGPDRASNAILCIMSDGKASKEDIATSVSKIGSLFGNGSIEIKYGTSMNNGQGLTAILLTSSIKDTKFSDYDPLAKILQFQVDEDLDTSLNVELPLSRLEEF